MSRFASNSLRTSFAPSLPRTIRVRKHGKGRARKPLADSRRAFSLAELVMVVIIIGLISAIAVPRISRAAYASRATALQGSLVNVRKAIDAYYAEHSRYPGQHPVSGVPDGTYFVNQLVQYSDENGNTSATYGGAFKFGPYLRAPFPANPSNGLRTVHVKATPTSAGLAVGSVGWVAVLLDGAFGVSMSDGDLDVIGATTPTTKFELRAGTEAL